MHDICKRMPGLIEINPLNVHGLRRLEHCPPHFLQVCFDLHTDERNITDWVYTNLTGRFYFGDYVLVDSAGKKSMCKMLAFEIHSEASYLGLFLDTINKSSLELW
jgi:hypothetical protein